MQNTEQNYIPIGTSVAGLCITPANWQEIKIGTIAYYLESLLVKPGYVALKEIPDLAAYLGWSGKFVLNATRIMVNKEGIFTLISPFDGSKLKLTYSQLMEIIQHIKPDAVILPKNVLQDFPEIWENWNDEITPFIASVDLLKQEVSRRHGVYFSVDGTGFTDVFLENAKRWSHLPRYFLTGSLSYELMAQLKIEGVEWWIESDEPAALAMKGIVFSQNGMVDLTENNTEMQFEVIDSACLCPTCSQQFTKAYLHHLYLHTPLLCQRFLIQHNAYYALKNCKTNSFMDKA